MTTYQRLTARGRGAIAVIEICGDEAIAVLNDCFTPVGKTSFANKNRGLVYGHWNSTGEDLLVVEAPTNDSGSSTQTETIRFEIQCHGSEAAVAAISADLKSRGAVESNAAAVKPASISDAPLSASQVRSDIEHLLSTAMTRRTAELLLHQLAIAPQAVEQVVLAGEQEAIDGILRWSDFGTRFHRRQSIVLCGRPNAGKSSLINAILGFERAIVTPIAGTTRDVLSHHTVIDGWPLELSDTAGLRAGGGQIERIGIARAKQQIENADLIVAVIDATDLAPWEEAIKPHLLVVNKTDLIEKGMPASSADIAKASELSSIPVVSVSAIEKTGIAELLATISKTLFPDLPPRGQAIPTTKSQVEALRSLSAATR